MSLLQLDRAEVCYGAVLALQAVTLNIQAGERVALIGANGSGKSSLLRLLHGLLLPSSGTRLCAPVAQAMLFQRPYMLNLSVLNNVRLALILSGRSWREATERAWHALQRVGLAELANRNARQLSGGQQQRLALARAWALEPALLLLDEPTASLDPHAKREVEALMEQLADSRHASGEPMTLVFASHNLGQVKRLASRVLYLEQGCVVADLPVQDFFNGPLPEPARLFIKGELG